MVGSSGAVAQLLIEQCAVFLALLLGASAIHKILRWRRALDAVREFAGVAPGLAAPAAALASAVELLAGALLMTPSYRDCGARIATVVLAVYLGLVVRALVLGRRDIDCGCSFGAGRRTLSGFEAGRNLVLLVLAVLVAVGGTVATPANASELVAAVAFLTLYAALDQVIGLGPMRQGTVL